MAGVLLQVYRPDIGCKTPELQVSAGWLDWHKGMHGCEIAHGYLT